MDTGGKPELIKKKSEIGKWRKREMSDLRKEFEAWAYSNKWNTFHCRADDEQYVDDFISGAWHMFQEKQKQIDAIKQHVVSFYAEADLWGFDSDQAIRQIDLIQELLK